MLMSPETVSGLARTVLATRYTDFKPTPQFHEEMWALYCSDHDKCAVAAPRGHAKTTGGTGAYLITALCLRVRRYAMIISGTEEQSVEFISELRGHFIDNDALMDMFDIDGLVKDSGTDIVVKFKDGARFRIIGKGAGQNPRGRLWMGTRPDIIIGDDLETEEQTDSDLRRAKFKRWFYGAVLPAGSDNCIYRIHGTILHFDSILENLMPDESDPETFSDDLRIFGRSKNNGEWLSTKYLAHNADFSQILWPEKFPEDRLRKIRADYVAQGIPEVYNQEYLNDPISEDNAYFKAGDLLPIEPKDRDLRKTFYAGGDLAISSRDRAAFTVFYVAGLDENGKLQVVYRAKGRWDSLNIIEEMFIIQNRFKPDLFFLEQENIAKAIGPVLNQEMRKRRVYINIEPSTPSKDKETRNRALQKLMRHGMVLFDKDEDWYPDCLRELSRFPKGPFKDDADALGLIAAGVDQLSDPMTDEEVEEDAWDEEYRQDYDLGRDLMTGY